MEYRSLGRTGAKVTPLCLGCMMFGRKTDEDTSMDMIDTALDAGINFIDTADVYGRGASETVVGKALKRNGKRDEIVLATKVHGKMSEEDPNMAHNTRKHIVEGCEASLERLQTDWIDLYQIHRPDPDIPIDETLRALDDLIRQGKVRYVGTSTFAAWQVVESLWVAEELGLNRFVSEQPPYHPLDRRAERELIPMCQTYGIGIIPWSPLAGGFLTGKYKPGQEPPEGSRLKGREGYRQQCMFSDAGYKVLEIMEKMANEKDCTMSQLALAWNAAQPGITSPIIGPRTPEQLDDNLGALDVEVTEEDCEKIDEVARPGEMIAPYYEAGFGPHPFSWL
ncbi:MAG: aldo/keto reductase [Phycisphaerae bacterium]